jgi:hypothetical protein
LISTLPCSTADRQSAFIKAGGPQLLVDPHPQRFDDALKLFSSFIFFADR